jgi:pantoate--beta-alanine ligase
MEVVTSIVRLRGLLAGGERVGLVPTMGALHAGHGALLGQARAECATVVASVFVNPTQFNQADDFERYPRTLTADARLCEQAGVDFVFAPAVEEMYPEPGLTGVDVACVSEGLCGQYRPGHFRGVATVVAKLLNIVRPHRAYFGEKDAQQLAVIRRMVRDLNMDVEIVPVATVREADGLAMSSRNRHLSAAERAQAPTLYRALCAARRAVEQGEREAATLRRLALAELETEPALRLEYLEIVDAGSMQPVAAVEAPVRIAAAVWLGATRLIDNVGC